uniref:ACB domain-containing protein n=1 Tax=Globisporangium ultimum (strain ATCC 200006 / CBS 805.95 / DAOM BR144) TaxID=431595 RepID=K3W869_GLOUD
MPSLMRSSSSAPSASAVPSAFGSVASQAAAINAFRSRLRSPSPASSIAETEDDLDLLSAAAMLPPVSPAQTGAHHAHGHSACDSCSALETEFAAAVLFVETYNGPHRILTQENSTPKKDFYAFYQQATVGPCPNAAPPPGLTKIETSKWEKWRNLGQMTRHEAMKRYTTALDNLVDDWRRSANSKRRSTSMFERLPRIYDELGELQDRVEEETKKREELEVHLLNFTREYRAMVAREMEQVDQMRGHLTSLVKTLEDDVTSHHNELQRVSQRQLEMLPLVEGSVFLAFETRSRQVYQILQGWIRNKTFRRVIVCLVLFRLWNFIRSRRMPQFVAQLLIRWLAAMSSLDAPNSISAASSGQQPPQR